MTQPQNELVIVTGSSGLIGDRTCHRLADGYRVVGLDKVEPRQPSPQVKFIQADLTSDKDVADAMTKVRSDFGDRIASVIHLAAYYDFSGEPSPLYDQLTVRGTERLLRELGNFHVEQFIFSSTMLVHAPCEPGQRIDESWPLDPKWDYPKSKVQAEQVIRTNRGNIPAVILRIAGVYDDRGHSVPLANQMQRIYERQLTSKVFPGAASHGQAFIHLDDVLEAIWLAVQRRKQLPEETVLLIAEDQTLSYDELQHTFARMIHGESWETRQIPKALAKTGAWVQDHIPGEDSFIKPWMIDLADDHYEVDISRARESLGWTPKHSLRETLPAMVSALKHDPAEFYKDNKLGEPPKGASDKSQ